tara:strand:+ start:151 stop:747 length:597 start_codon:yes stop_codon:yes gene_type:complete
MGLIVSHLKTLDRLPSKALYMYLLDYGWPDGKYEKLFKTHFNKLAEKASASNSVVITSNKGVHFANEVLAYYKVLDLDPSKVLPGILITKAPPSYFKETSGPEEHSIDTVTDPLVRDGVVIIPLKACCESEADFINIIESIFSDLEKGTSISNFQVSEHDSHHRQTASAFGSRVTSAIILQPNIFGVGVDLKTLFSRP